MPPFTHLTLALVAGVLLDRLLGEPRRYHPLVGFGTLATWLERRLNRPGHRIARGALAWALAVLPWVLAAAWLRVHGGLLAIAIDVGLLWFALGARSLVEHAHAVAVPLQAGDLAEARRRVGWIVSRDTAALNPTQVAAAGTESVLENGNDAIFGTLFWFLVAGGPGAVLFRLANTLDAMWGYRTERYLHFGRLAARVDDVLGWLPARLTALSYALLGHTRHALHCWRHQGPGWKSPNAGPVMAAGAGALRVQLGGEAPYHGAMTQRPPLGSGSAPDANSLFAAIALVNRSLALWIGISLLAGAIAWGLPHA
ncbi:adenosylcobinamide-phosphate synthase CbiB [Denitromonas halophila]|uniref:Cobalamin biosynthesis protein CobD n=1 Tax=Denitromonas halophila TaxID=1629404 RepID=A0A557R064_9RHOO|nr:adenosylcobinamide-phosphate synthase CbiB [Denitromonas halophila]TVO58551.1 cobalamin biosynthesis protein [Denitromonas halophila]